MAMISAGGLASFGFSSFGFGSTSPSSWADGALTAASSAAVILRDPASQDLTRWRQALQIALRVLGPLLVGLALLAIRGRIKR